jgi:hypothetical protein
MGALFHCGTLANTAASKVPESSDNCKGVGTTLESTVCVWKAVGSQNMNLQYAFDWCTQI